MEYRQYYVEIGKKKRYGGKEIPRYTFVICITIK